MTGDFPICLYCLETAGPKDPCPYCGQPRGFQNPPGALSPGTTLADRYMVGRCIGQGGFGITYLAWEEQLTRPVALKEFFPREISYRDNDHATVQPMKEYKEKFADILERFLLEARTVATFHQPNIVPIWFSFEENSTAYFVMPYRRGQTLEEWLYENRDEATEESLLNIFVPLVRGLEAVHQAGILHRDIKPRNMYIDEDDTPLLLDFGSARNVMSESFSIMMTHGYAPLEQYFSQQTSKQGRQGPWTDIYAVAASMYACIRCEFDGPHLVPIQRAPERVNKDEVEHIRRVAKIKVGSAVAEAVMRGLRVNLKERPQTALEFREMIEPEPAGTTLPPPPDQKLEMRCIAGEYQDLAVPLSPTPIIIGWDPNTSNLVCSETVISSRHCLVYAEHGLAYVKDLNSLNGTFVNDSERLRPEKPALLRPGDTINLAGVIVFQIASAETPPPLPPGPSRPGKDETGVSGPVVKPGRQSLWKKIFVFLFVVVLAAGVAAALYVKREDWFVSSPPERPSPPATIGPVADTVEPVREEPSKYVNSVGMEFVPVLSGTFMMGSPDDEPGRRPGETPTAVTISRPFYIQTTEVTQGQWRQVMGGNPSVNGGCGDDCPVENVSWVEVQEFIRRLNSREGGPFFRLPTQEEWEYACRAGSGGPYSGGDLDEVGWYRENSGDRTHPVKERTPNAWGLYDMHGNVWEWTHSPVGGDRIGRGGGFTSGPDACRAAVRNPGQPGFKNNDLGLRLVMEADRSPRPGFACENPYCYQAVLKAELLYLDDVDGQVGQGTQKGLVQYKEAFGLVSSGPPSALVDQAACRALQVSYNALGGVSVSGQGATKMVSEWCAVTTPLAPPPKPAAVKKKPRPPRVVQPKTKKEIEKIIGPQARPD